MLLGGCTLGGAFAVAGAYPLPVVGDGGVGSGFFQFRHQGGLAGLDLLELPVTVGGLLGGGGGRQLRGQHGGAVAAEHALVQHPGDDLRERLVGEAGVHVAGILGGDAGVVHSGWARVVQVDVVLVRPRPRCQHPLALVMLRPRVPCWRNVRLDARVLGGDERFDRYGRMSALPESVSRLIVPVPNLTVSQVWEVGRVHFHPAGSAAKLVENAINRSSPAPFVLPQVMTDKVTELGQGVVAEVTASGLGEVMSLVEGALAVLRVVQRMRHPMHDNQRLAFGLPGQVKSAAVAYFALSGGLSMGGARVGALAGWTFSDDDHEGWVTDPVYRYVDAALARAEADRTALERRALVTIDLLSEAWLSWQPDMALLNSAMALEVLLGEETDRPGTKFRLARRVSYFLCGWSGDNSYTAGKRPACPLLALPMNPQGQPKTELANLIKDMRAGQAAQCSQFLDVLDLYEARSRIVHGGRLGLTESQQTQATWFIANWLLPQVLAWFADHPAAALTELDGEIASLPASGAA